MLLAVSRRRRAAWLVVAAVALAACRPTAPAPPQPAAPPPITQTGQFRAVLINGGGKPAINFQSHLTHVRTLADFLRAHDVPAEDIVIFSGDGADPAADLSVRANELAPDTWLLPRALEHRLRPVKLIDSTVPGFTLHPATRDALRAWFADQGSKLGPGDTLLLYVTDHGEENKDNHADNTIVLWNESLSVTQLRELLALLNPDVRVVMLMSQCFSGSFANAMWPPNAPLGASGNVCGYFASTADRPAYGCYPENRGLDGVGHSHHFFEAMDALGAMSEADARVAVTDDSPDVPNTTSDFYLQQLLLREATKEGRTPAELTDEYVGKAFKVRAEWEPEIRFMDRIGGTFGMFSPRSLSELELQTMMLPQVSEQLRTYARRWEEALNALLGQNFERFLAAHPDWKERLTPKTLDELDDEGRRQLTAELLAALVPFTEADKPTYERLELLKQRADDAGAAAYRMEVRLGVVLRMRSLLARIAGRVYLAENGTPEERETYARLLACEDVRFFDSPEYASAAQMPPPAPFPSLDEDRQVVQVVMPAWMGIEFQAASRTIHKRDNHPPGAVTVMTVFPDSAAAKAGIEVGDVIIGPPGEPFTEPAQVREWTMRREIGEPAPLVLVRAGQRREITLKPEPYPMKVPELPGPPKVGSPAPELKLEPFRGEIELSNGRPHLLFFWATWCGPCKFALPELMAYAAERNVDVIAVTDEDAETLTGFFNLYKEPFPKTVAIDPYRRAFRAFGVSGTPTFVLIGADGKVQSTHTGYNPKEGLKIEGWKYVKK